ncbi:MULTISPECIES: serine hydrolase domain-containing protein [unclassified Streptomyces]|uniref:serine hydrolase domain-containing protein n=1 Tax=unclassified Streptomyces TaxID=2593676 RepID=UPI002E2CF2DC|nr:serine hydrolase domain-containing protein [Streptomyces sp. NBC_01439]
MTEHVHGTVDARFARVREVLAEHLSSGLDLGFGFCAYHRGEVVADLWGGHSDADRRATWGPDTLLPLASITKAVLSTALWRLAALGHVDVDAPVSRYWPEFASHGKSCITIATVLSHRAGIPAFADPVSLKDELERWRVLRKLEGLTPLWTPGEAHGYHAVVFGFLICELIRRITGNAASEAVHRRVAGPLALDLHMRLGPDETGRLARIFPAASPPPATVPVPLKEYADGLTDRDSLLYRATFGSSAMTPDDVNNPAYHRLERPAAYGTARAVAKLFAALSSDIPEGRLLTRGWLQRATAERSSGLDEVFRLHTRWATGFMLPGGPLWPDFGRPAFGHIGATGALAFGDPEREFSFAFLPNKMKSLYEVPDHRAQRLTRTCYEALDRVP